MDERINWSKQFCLDHKPDALEPLPEGFVIERKDFKEIKSEGEDGSSTFIQWEYLERWVPIYQWLAQQAILQKENSETIMMGMCDLYEQNLGE